MSGIQTGPAYAGYRDSVRDQMMAGQPFGEVEATIEEAKLEPEAKSALWLFASSIHHQREQREANKRRRDAARGRGGPQLFDESGYPLPNAGPGVVRRVARVLGR